MDEDGWEDGWGMGERMDGWWMRDGWEDGWWMDEGLMRGWMRDGWGWMRDGWEDGWGWMRDRWEDGWGMDERMDEGWMMDGWGTLSGWGALLSLIGGLYSLWSGVLLSLIGVLLSLIGGSTLSSGVLLSLIGGLYSLWSGGSILSHLIMRLLWLVHSLQPAALHEVRFKPQTEETSADGMSSAYLFIYVFIVSRLFEDLLSVFLMTSLHLLCFQLLLYSFDRNYIIQALDLETDNIM